MFRRDALALGTLTLGASGCKWVGRALGDALPDTLSAPAGRARALLERAAFGPRPGDVQRVDSMGVESWIEEQLTPERIDDTECDVRTAFVDAWHLPVDLAFELRPEHVETQLSSYNLIRAIYSQRQLHEVMTHFWSDHFHVAIAKAECKHLTLVHARDAIRPHALGSFRDLLRAATLSPAMLVYLDGRENSVGTPNENHARELLELHTLGVHGGYSQRDVMEAARCLGGWRVRRRHAPGQVVFRTEHHDAGRKTVLGRRIEPAGPHEIDVLLDALVRHPSCARFVATKLVRFFVHDDPPTQLVERVARAFGPEGNTRAALRTLLRSDAAYAGTKLKRPFRFVASAFRALGADVSPARQTQAHLESMGHAPFRHPTPDGYAHDTRPWLGTLAGRWRFAAELAHGELENAEVDVNEILERAGGPEGAWTYLLGRAPTPNESTAIEGVTPAETLALALSSPGYQRS